MPLLEHHGATLRSVKLHGVAGQGGDALRARGQLERALADVDWSPPGLPPHALLFVRKLVADGRRGLHPQTEGGSFGQAVSQALRQQVHAARRPWLHADAAEAAAICFADEAELVACLLRDWVQGHLPHRWWWQTVLRGRAPLPWLRQQVLVRGELLAPALVQLAQGPQALAWLARLEEPDAVVALRAVERAYGVPQGSGALPAHATAPPIQGKHPRDRAVSRAPPSGKPTQRRRGLRRLLSLLPELRAQRLGEPQTRLLACALATERAPEWLRSASFADAVTQCLGVMNDVRRVAEHSAPPVAPPAPTLPASSQAQSSPRSATAAVPEPHAETPHAPAATPINPAPTAPRSADLPSAAALGMRSAEHSPLPTPVDDAPTAAAPAAALAPEPAEGVAQLAAPSQQPSTSALQPALPDGAPPVHTRYGGIFYLLNAALALELYADFTRPRTPGLPLSPWDLLAWTGSAWFGDDFTRDPVWALLATLSGRAIHKAPAHDFAAPAAWQLDALWLAPWGEARALQVQATRHRLRVMHPQGFAVFDVARDRCMRPLAQARALCAPHAALRTATLQRLRTPTAAVPRSARARWLQHWLAYLNARLACTLGVDSVSLPAQLCRHAAAIHLSASSVSVHLALANLPLPVRFAGLDRDQGWIPAAGRSLLFRFT